MALGARTLSGNSVRSLRLRRRLVDPALYTGSLRSEGRSQDLTVRVQSRLSLACSSLWATCCASLGAFELGDARLREAGLWGADTDIDVAVHGGVVGRLMNSTSTSGLCDR